MMRRDGFTMIELVVVLVILGAIAAMVGQSIRDVPRPPPDALAQRVYWARQSALRSGKPARTQLADSGNGSAVALPDGSVIADSAAHVDRFTGRVIADHGAAK